MIYYKFILGQWGKVLASLNVIIALRFWTSKKDAYPILDLVGCYS